jgi:hypothetical protein
MFTDAPPRKTNREDFLKSDRIRTLDLPQNGGLLPSAKSIEVAMTEGTSAAVRRACVDFLAEAAQSYRGACQPAPLVPCVAR